MNIVELGQVMKYGEVAYSKELNERVIMKDWGLYYYEGEDHPNKKIVDCNMSILYADDWEIEGTDESSIIINYRVDKKDYYTFTKWGLKKPKTNELMAIEIRKSDLEKFSSRWAAAAENQEVLRDFILEFLQGFIYWNTTITISDVIMLERGEIERMQDFIMREFVNKTGEGDRM